MGCLAVVIFVLTAPLLPFLAQPLLAFGPAALFGWGAWRCRGRRQLPQLLAALAWAGFALYERRMPAVELEQAAELRLDLLVVVPLLWLATVLGGLAWRRAGRAERERSGSGRR